MLFVARFPKLQTAEENEVNNFVTYFTIDKAPTNKERNNQEITEK